MTDQLDPQSADGRHALAVRHLLALAKSANLEVEFIDQPPPNIRIFLATDHSCRYTACTIKQATAFIDACSERVIRGGSFRYSARGCRAAYHIVRPPVERYDRLGFRPVAEVKKGVRVFRGGGFGDPVRWCRAAYRHDWLPVERNGSLGFRPVAEVKKGVRVFRGGSFRNSARGCRAAFRSDWLPDVRFDSLGFRPVAEGKC
jgi:formylglycine-generating enzyme required for sulfatase activity